MKYGTDITSCSFKPLILRQQPCKYTHKNTCQSKTYFDINMKKLYSPYTEAQQDLQG